MSKRVQKRKYLVKECESIKEYLEKDSYSFKLYNYTDKNSSVYEFEDFIYVLEEYKKPLLGLYVLVLVSNQEIELFEQLEEITDDKRYKKEYLKRFGNPSSYDFNPKDVFRKCDSVGLIRLDLHFSSGMSSLKVFRVLLYRLNQLFSLQYENFVNKNSGFDVLQDSHKRLKTMLGFSKGIFDKKIIKILLKDFDDLYMLINHKSMMDRYKLNFELFIQEDSQFYWNKDKEMPIYSFIYKKLTKNLEKSKEKLDNMYHQSMVSREYVTNLDEISYIKEYFSSVFTDVEIKKLNSQIQALKQSNIRH